MGGKLEMSSYNPEAAQILASIKCMKPKWLGSFFDAWVHDSYAGFISDFEKKDASNWVKSVMGAAHIAAEAQRYVRWRQLYAGSEEGLNAQLPEGTAPKGKLASVPTRNLGASAPA